ncbi:unnamed protein product, partial [Onchocerca flexuosa]|uniref:Alpha-1,3-glucosyltransferase n=1 Tax=Onchocerca flexuosa TaxID=387005 RepID=A0A183H4S7_9BILA
MGLGTNSGERNIDGRRKGRWDAARIRRDLGSVRQIRHLSLLFYTSLSLSRLRYHWGHILKGFCIAASCCVVEDIFATPYSYLILLIRNRLLGHATPPMYGDYEAQRHWMEITYHLPVNQYINGSDNDLNYWGLDYPPLTAYHSWLLGSIANKLNRSWVELHISRGIETESHKIFMRITVLVTYWTIYISSLLLSIGFFRYTLSQKMLNYCAVAVLYPGLLVMDSGHFQYNHVSLGLFLFSFACFVSSFLKLGSVFFVLALNFKQMELYHALPIAIYLLSRSFPSKNQLSTREEDELDFSLILCSCRYLSWAKQLFVLFITVTITFLFVWLPFLVTKSDLIQILHRIFPFYRGIFEDKVANFWCAVNTLYKLKSNFEIMVLLRV